MFEMAPGREHLPVFCAMALFCALYKYKNWSTSDIKTTPEFKKFQWNYLTVKLLMKTADWLQGPYVYALYRNYGYSKAEIGYLFIAGFGVSGFVGVAVGNYADKHGRKAGCVIFTILYSLACVCYHFNNFYILLLGRACAGVGTALLYSVFEAWYKSEHEQRGYDKAWVSQTFNIQTFGDAVLAILAGLVASFLAEHFGDIAAFDASMCCLLVGGFFILTTWNENKAAKKEGESDDEVSVMEAVKMMWNNPEIGLTGCVQSLFGGSMYIFVFMWTPSLPDSYNPGIIFSCFMCSIMIGTCIFSDMNSSGWSLSGIVLCVVMSSIVLFLLPALTEDANLRLVSFILYEVVVGIWFPSYHSMRAQVVPDRGHATILSFFRLPLNIIVVLVIWNMHKLSVTQVFSTCTVMMSIGSYLMYRVHSILDSKRKIAAAKEGETKKDK